jgi:hypothetical protein
MAFVRSIKATFFTSEDIVTLSMAGRLLYIGLWLEADREGRFVWKPRSFKLRYLPTDDVDIEAVCDELLARRLVVRYGEGLAYIPSFSLHQRPNFRESASTLTAPDACMHASPRVNSRVTTRESSVSEGKERKEEERKGEEGEGKTTAAVAAFPRPLPPVGISADAWQEVVADWNAAIMVAPELPKAATALQSASRNRITKALRELPDLNAWRARFDRVARSKFCRGTNDRGWTADLWWTLEHGDAIDTGRYDDKDRAAAPAAVSSRYDIDLDAAVQAQLALRRPS